MWVCVNAKAGSEYVFSLWGNRQQIKTLLSHQLGWPTAFFFPFSYLSYFTGVRLVRLNQGCREE